MSLPARFLETVRQYDMLRAGDAVVAGVSGGADSMALLCLLLNERERLGLSALEVCHVHHGIRGEEAERDLLFVQRFCSENGIPFHVRRVDATKLSQETGTSVEEAGRRARYAFLKKRRMNLPFDSESRRNMSKSRPLTTAATMPKPFF